MDGSMVDYSICLLHQIFNRRPIKICNQQANIYKDAVCVLDGFVY